MRSKHGLRSAKLLYANTDTATHNVISGLQIIAQTTNELRLQPALGRQGEDRGKRVVVQVDQNTSTTGSGNVSHAAVVESEVAGPHGAQTPADLRRGRWQLPCRHVLHGV
eukprot:6208772-Pleurochrysis_carterae.AAC.1